MIEINVDTMAVDVDGPTAEEVKEGAAPIVTVHVVAAGELPFSDPNNPNRPMRFPSMIVNYNLNKEAGQKLIDLLQEKVDALPSTSSSKLAIVSDMSEAGKVAQLDRNLRT